MTARSFDFYNKNRLRIYQLAKESSWIIAGQFVSVLGALMLVRVLTEYLDPAEYGQLAIGLTIGGLANQVVIGGLSNGICRYYLIAKEKRDMSNYFDQCTRLLGYASLVSLLIAFLLLSALVLAELKHWITLTLIVFLYSVLAGYISTLSGIQNIARQRSVVAIHGAVDAWLKLSLAVVFILWLGSSAINVLLGYLFSAILITVSQLFFLNRLMNQHFSPSLEDTQQNWILKVWSFSWPFSVFGFFTWLQQASDRWALQGLATPTDVGQYAVVYQVGFAPIGLLLGLLHSIAAPILYQRAGDASELTRITDAHRLLWQIAIGGLMLTAIAFVISWLLHEWLFAWLVSEKYRDVSVYLPWVIMAGGLFSIGQMLSLKLVSELRSRDLLYVKIGSAVIGVLTNMLGAWLFGVAGVVIGLALFSTLFFIWMVILTWRIKRQPGSISVDNQ